MHKPVHIIQRQPGNTMINQQERRDRIIEAVVTSFLETGEPVSSSYVAKTSYLGLSSASIRNIMKELEKDGYLTHPHTSAGRDSDG